MVTHKTGLSKEHNHAISFFEKPKNTPVIIVSDWCKEYKKISWMEFNMFSAPTGCIHFVYLPDIHG